MPAPSKLFLCFLLMLCLNSGYAQNNLFLTLNDRIKVYYNPALARDSGKTSFDLLGTYSKLILDNKRNRIHSGAFAISASHALLTGKKHTLVLGFMHLEARNQWHGWQENLLKQSSNRFNASFEYNMKPGYLLIGTYFDRTQLVTDTTFRVSNQNPDQFAFNSIGLGIGYRSINRRFEIGLSGVNIRVPNFNFDADTGVTEKISRDFDCFNLQTSYLFKINSNLKIAPSLFLKYRAFITFQSTVLLEYKNKYLLGLGYITTTDSPVIRLGWQNKRLGIHYASNNYFYWHSIAVRYQLGTEQVKK